MIAGTESYLRHIHWLKDTRTIPAWEAMGIAHGFEGKGFELPSDVASLDQVHGCDIISLEELTHKTHTGDGYITGVKQQKIAVKTADCVPILIVAPQGVLALHAGWKGLAQNILGRAMEQLGSQRIKAQVGIGPCIGLESFEVGPEVVTAFRSGPFRMNEVEFAFACSKGVADRWHLDLATLAVLQLQRFEFPAEQIHVIRTCTVKHPELYHSYRRDGSAAGRNWSWIRA